MSAANMSMKSGAKKGYYVRIAYGTKTYILAQRMRAPRAEARYKYLST
ncbi:hypothetical protein [Pandoraea sp. NPDC087047]